MWNHIIFLSKSKALFFQCVSQKMFLVLHLEDKFEDLTIEISRTFTCMAVPEQAFGVGAGALDVMDGGGPPHTADAPPGESVG